MSFDGSWKVAGIAAVVVLASGCADKKATAIVLAIQSEAQAPRDVDSLEVQVDRSGGTSFFQSYALGSTAGSDATLPGTLTVSLDAGGDTSSPVTITIRAKLGSEERVLRRATMGFVSESTKLLRMPIRYSCVDFPCAAGETCTGGVCVQDAVDVTTLPDVASATDVFTTTTGGCFDERADQGGCFSASTVSAAVSAAGTALQGCKLDAAAFSTANGGGAMPGNSGQLNVALRWASAADAEHYEVLDEDPVEGWTFVPGSTTVIQFAPGICAAITGQNPRANAIRVSTKCAPKSSAQTICTFAPAKTLADDPCFQCVYEPAHVYQGKSCKDWLTAGQEDAAAKDYLACFTGCAFSGTYSSAAQCPQACSDACAEKIDPSCAASLTQGVCATKYAALLSYVECVDDAHGGLPDDVVDDASTQESDCASMGCAAEGYTTCVAALSSSGGAGGSSSSSNAAAGAKSSGGASGGTQ